jgi:hypothetical protein
MSLYSQDHPHSNGLEVLMDGHCRDWPILFALVVERLQRIEMDLAAARAEIDKLKASDIGVTHGADAGAKERRF